MGAASTGCEGDGVGVDCEVGCDHFIRLDVGDGQRGGCSSVVASPPREMIAGGGTAVTADDDEP